MTIADGHAHPRQAALETTVEKRGLDKGVPVDLPRLGAERDQDAEASPLDNDQVSESTKAKQAEPAMPLDIGHVQPGHGQDQLIQKAKATRQPSNQTQVRLGGRSTMVKPVGHGHQGHAMSDARTRANGPDNGHGQADRTKGRGRPPAPADDDGQYEERIRSEQRAHFQRLKDEAHAVFGMVDGRPGVRSLADWQTFLERAGDEIGNGRFIVRYLGAERYLDAATVAVLITLRQNLIAELGTATSTANLMMIDTAVISYYNFLRVQGWIGNLSLVFEREVFGQSTLNEVHGPTAGERLREQLEHLTEVILPLQERAHRMLMKSLENLTRTD